jgi:hypothetical protein
LWVDIGWFVLWVDIGWFVLWVDIGWFVLWVDIGWFVLWVDIGWFRLMCWRSLAQRSHEGWIQRCLPEGPEVSQRLTPPLRIKRNLNFMNSLLRVG